MTMADVLQQRNKFGRLADFYVKHRRGYPEQLYAEIRKRLGGECAAALDVGCGTGLVTVELAQFCKTVYGVDKENEMIETARAVAPNMKFEVASAEALPFPDHSFDLLTVGQSFHWFDKERAVVEFKRVVRPGGLVAIFRKSRRGQQRLLEDFAWDVLQRYAISDALATRGQSDFSMLKSAGFSSCERIELPFEERYTPDEYVGFLQSHSTYNLIPENKRAAYHHDLLEEMSKYLEAGYIVTRGIVEAWFLTV